MLGTVIASDGDDGASIGLAVVDEREHRRSSGLPLGRWSHYELTIGEMRILRNDICVGRFRGYRVWILTNGQLVPVEHHDGPKRGWFDTLFSRKMNHGER